MTDVDTKTLLIQPTDVGLMPLGATSSVASVEVEVSTDRDVAINDGRFIAGGVPFVVTSMSTDGLSVPVVANDDPAIAAGDGFSLLVVFTYTPRRGQHLSERRVVRRIIITSADPDVVPYAQAPPVVAVPFYMRPSEYVAYLEAETVEQKADLESAQATIASQASTLAAVQARNAQQASTITGLQVQVDQQKATIAAQNARIAALLRAGGKTDTTPPTPPTIAVTGSTDSTVTVTVSGGSDSNGVTQYRVQVDGGVWQVTSGPATFTGLSASSTHVISAQAGDPFGNWSPSVSATVQTTAPPVTTPDLTVTGPDSAGNYVVAGTGVTGPDAAGNYVISGTGVSGPDASGNYVITSS